MLSFWLIRFGLRAGSKKFKFLSHPNLWIILVTVELAALWTLRNAKCRISSPLNWRLKDESESTLWACWYSVELSIEKILQSLIMVCVFWHLLVPGTTINKSKTTVVTIIRNIQHLGEWEKESKEVVKQQILVMLNDLLNDFDLKS